MRNPEYGNELVLRVDELFRQVHEAHEAQLADVSAQANISESLRDIAEYEENVFLKGIRQATELRRNDNVTPFLRPGINPPRTTVHQRMHRRKSLAIVAHEVEGVSNLGEPFKADGLSVLLQHEHDVPVRVPTLNIARMSMDDNYQALRIITQASFGDFDRRVESIEQAVAWIFGQQVNAAEEQTATSEQQTKRATLRLIRSEPDVPAPHQPE